MFAYLDNLGDVVAASSTEYTLVQAQAAIPEITTVVANAPDGLFIKGTQSASQPYWHRHTSGDGTELAHYSEVEELGPLKASRMLEIDERSRELIDEGFEYPSESGNVFSLSLESQAKMTAAHCVRNDVLMVYPQRWNTRDNSAAVTITDSAGLHAFYMTAIGTVRARLDSGTALKDSIRAAATRAEVDVVVDDR